MAITSRGYPGPVTASDYAILSRHQGQTYAVLSPDDYLATPGTGTGGVSVAGGVAIGHGVMATSTGATALNADIQTAAGSRWDCVALERNWVTKVSSLVILKGTSAKTLPATRLTAYGTGTDHQPLFLIRMENGFTAVREWIDLRVWQQDGGMFAADPMARDYLTALGTDMLCQNKVRYIRVKDPTSGLPVWSEHRAAAFGPRPYYMLGRNAQAVNDTPPDAAWKAFGANVTDTEGDATTHFTHVAGTSSANPGYLQVKTRGLYAINARYSVSASSPISGFAALEGDWTRITDAQAVRDNPGTVGFSLSDVVFLEAGAKIRISGKFEGPVRPQLWYLWATRIGD